MRWARRVVRQLVGAADNSRKPPFGA